MTSAADPTETRGTSVVLVFEDLSDNIKLFTLSWDVNIFEELGQSIQLSKPWRVLKFEELADNIQAFQPLGVLGFEELVQNI